MPAGEHLYRTEAVVLRRSDLGEADRILTLFARGYGKIRAVAKGVRKPASKKVGHDDVERSVYAAHFVELIDAFTEDADQHDDLYDLLVSGLNWLCGTSDMRR